ncbi:MAG: hypothetical protein Kow0069_04700 [Promethearchaeota archaeon]
MELENVNRVAVVGAGDMGHGIAEACALSGYEVVLVDVAEAALQTAERRIEDSLRVLARKRKLKRDAVPEVLARVSTTTRLGDASSAQLLIEAVPEVMDLKRDVLADAEKLLPGDAPLATNTSNMRITDLAAKLRDPGRLAGLHFFNPAVLMRTVEVVPGEGTSGDVLDLLSKFVESLGKLPIRVLWDSPGFVVNRVLVAAQVLATRAVERGLIEPENLDAVARKMGIPMGPFETMDYVGLDVVVHGMNYFGETLGQDYAPPAWLVELVDAGKLGKKTGGGIFQWPGGKRPTIDLEKATEAVKMGDLMCVQINEATKLLEERVVDGPETVDLAIKNGTANAMGLFGLLKGMGPANVAATCEKFAEQLGVGAFAPTAALLGWNG